MEDHDMDTARVFTPEQLWMPEFIANPYPTYDNLRDQSPLSIVSLPSGTVAGIDGPIRSWALMKHDDCYDALRDHNTFSSVTSLVGRLAPRLHLLQDDPPQHTRLRRIVNQTFTPKRVQTLTPWIASVAAELLDEIDSAETDIVRSYAIPLPMKVIARLLGIPGEDYSTFKHWSESVLAFTSLPPEQRANSTNEMMIYFHQMVSARRAEAAEDLITALVQADVEGGSLRESEVLGFCLLLLIAGNETTTHLISNLLNLLADRPELWRQLREDRSLVDAVIASGKKVRFSGFLARRHETWKSQG
jgi:cytochrome P450